MNLFHVVLLLFFQIPAPAGAPDIPPETGVYVRPGSTGWVRLQPAPIAEMKISGMDLFVTTSGYTNLGMSIVCKGAKAGLRIAVPKPTFFVRGAGSSKEAMLIRLDPKRNKRTFQTSTSAVSVENKAGFKKGAIRKIAVTEYADHSYALSPEGDLSPGEYLLVFGSTSAGFDFGIDREK